MINESQQASSECSDLRHDMCGTFGGAGICGNLMGNVYVCALDPVFIPCNTGKADLVLGTKYNAVLGIYTMGDGRMQDVGYQ